MDRKSYEIYQLSEKKERKLWNDSVIIFDTSALIDFYYYPKETRIEIFNKIFPKLKDRLWVPYHVQFEYLKNRERIIKKIIEEKYLPLKEENIKNIISAKSKILNNIKQIKKNTKKSERHPFLPQEIIDNFIIFTEKIDKKIKQFEKDLNTEIEKQIFEINSLKENDTILKAFEDNFKVGNNFDFSKIMKIVGEGKLRYEFEIPPGYKDFKDKIGTQIFGDLIVWKQILSYSKKENKDVIFICNDLKIDWCHVDSRNRIQSPRKELIKEFNDNNFKEFWMYNQSQFLYKAKEFLKVDITDSKIKEISNIIDNQMNINQKLLFNHLNKVFISYHINDEYYKNKFEELFSNRYFDIIISKSVQTGDINEYLSSETIRQKIIDDSRDSTVTVVLIGSETWKSKYIDMEIEASQYNSKSGLIGILLPYYRDYAVYDTHTIPSRLAKNIEKGFAKLHKWSENPYIVKEWISEASKN